MVKILRKYNLSCIVSMKITKVLYKKTCIIQTWKISNSSSFTMTMKNVSILHKFMKGVFGVQLFFISFLLSTDKLKISRLIHCQFQEIVRERDFLALKDLLGLFDSQSVPIHWLRN